MTKKPKVFFTEKPICGFGGMNDLAAKALFGSKAKSIYTFGENSIAIVKHMPKGYESRKWHVTHESEERAIINKLLTEKVPLKEAYRYAHASVSVLNGDFANSKEGLEDADKMIQQAKKCKIMRED